MKRIITCGALIIALVLGANVHAVEMQGTDSTNHAKTVLIDASRRLVVSVASFLGGIVVETANTPLVFDADNAGNCAAITNASVQQTLDNDSDHFRICAWGNTAYVLCGADPTATTGGGGFSFLVADGQCHTLTIENPKCAVIGNATAGNICFMSLEEP
jgi:hypothetical protein